MVLVALETECMVFIRAYVIAKLPLLSMDMELYVLPLTESKTGLVIPEGIVSRSKR